MMSLPSSLALLVAATVAVNGCAPGGQSAPGTDGGEATTAEEARMAPPPDAAIDRVDSRPIAPAQDGGTVSAGNQAYTRLYSGPTSGFSEPAELVIRDAAAFEQVFASAMGEDMLVPPVPDVRFAREMVIVLALGQRNTGGYGIRFDGITADGTGATVRYTTTSPGPNCMTTQMLTSPVEIVSVPRVEGPVRFDARRVVEPC
jgi:hypothetical protein